MTTPQPQPVAPPPPPSPTAGASDPTTAAAALSSNIAALTTSSTFSSMADLRSRAPQVYKAMMEGIAWNICNEMQEHQARLKELMDEGRGKGSY